MHILILIIDFHIFLLRAMLHLYVKYSNLGHTILYAVSRRGFACKMPTACIYNAFVSPPPVRRTSRHHYAQPVKSQQPIFYFDITTIDKSLMNI
jgi:hypothetical protein